MRNHLTDLNDHLFAEMERLSDEDLTDEQIEREIKRAKAVTSVAQAIVANGNLALRAAEFSDSALSADTTVPAMLTDGGRG